MQIYGGESGGGGDSGLENSQDKRYGIWENVGSGKENIEVPGYRQSRSATRHVHSN